MELNYYSNLIKPLVNHCKKILLKLKLYQIERSITSSHSTSINWFIVIFILSLLMLKTIHLLEKQCSYNGFNNSVVIKSLYSSKLEKRFQKFFECHNDFWELSYIVTSVMCDILVIAAAVLSKSYLQLVYPYNILVYPWLFFVAIHLIGEIFLIAKDFGNSKCPPAALHIIILGTFSELFFDGGMMIIEGGLVEFLIPLFTDLDPSGFGSTQARRTLILVL